MELLGTSTAAIRVLLSEDYITTLIDWLDPPLFSWPEHRRISALAATIKRSPDLFAQPSVAALVVAGNHNFATALRQQR